MNNIIRSSTGALLAGLVAAGCSTAPPASDVAAANAAISNAGQAIDQAQANPRVAQYAPGELERASDSLNKAKAAWNDKHDLSKTTHLAYLAQQRAATAQELANGRAAEHNVLAAANERNSAVTRVMAQRETEAKENAVAPAPAPEGLAGFAFGKARLPPNAAPVIDQLADNLKKNPDEKVVIEGHTDNVGSPAYNQTLALERAQAVRSALVRQGIDVNRITVRSLGEENPVASNDTSEGRRENRRAQVIIGGEQTAVGSSQGAAATASGEGEQRGQRGQHKQEGQQGQTQTEPPPGQTEPPGQNGQDDRRER